MLARAQAVEACQTWQTSLSQDAGTFPSTQASALSLAQSAAAADAQWQPIVDTMSQLTQLIGDDSADGITKGRQALANLSAQCAPLGVVVGAG